MKTFSAKAQDIERAWHLIDAAGQPVGKVAVAAARLLRGKHKTLFTPHVDTGDHVVVINAGEATFSGNKETDKIYTRYTGYVGNQKVETPRKIRARRPGLILELAIKGMVPKNRLGRQQLSKLKVCAGPDHPHQAQDPKPYELPS